MPAKFAVALMENDFHGGIGIREAIASGAVPILLNQTAYRDLLGSNPSYKINLVSLESLASDIAHVIQLAVAPVFLLSGVGVTLGVLATRLGRIIDRAWVLALASGAGRRTGLPGRVAVRRFER